MRQVKEKNTQDLLTKFFFSQLQFKPRRLGEDTPISRNKEAKWKKPTWKGKLSGFNVISILEKKCRNGLREDINWKYVPL